MLKKEKIELLKKMKLIRIVEESIAKKYSENKMRCPTHLCSGQEAVSAAIGQLLKNSDYVVSTHRPHGHYLAKGGNLKKMLAEIYGKSNGCSKGYGGSMHLIDLKVNFMGSTAIVGNSLPVGAGLALTINIEKSNKISCIFLGDGCVEEGVFHETVNFCALKKLPVLFVCENNLYSVYSSLLVRQPKNRSITKMVNAMGIKSFCVDGNDVCKIYDIALRELSKIRSGLGPRFFEFKTYRWREHCGPNFDNNIGYRSEKEFQKWKNKDPIKKYEKKLLEKKEITTEEINKININLLKRINLAFDYAEKSPFPKPSEAFKNVYAL
jgi:pyruvate dehydrogenase E1 component alpha subunit